MPEHNTITDPNIHEPKGISTAAAGTVYAANGSGSGSWVTINLPSQSGNANKILTSDGTSASWSTRSVRAMGSWSTNGVSDPTVNYVDNITCTHASTGYWTFAFGSSLATTNYVIQISGSANVNSGGNCYHIINKTVSGFQLEWYNSANGSVQDPIAGYGIEVAIVGGF